MLAAMLEDIYLSEESQAALEVRILTALSEEQRERLSALVVGPLIADADSARAMTAEFIAALARNRHRREVESLRRAVSTANYAAFHLLIADFVANWALPDQRARLGRMFEHRRMSGAACAG